MHEQAACSPFRFGQVEPLGDHSFAQVFEGLDSTVKRLGDLSIGPGRTIGICLEQEVSPPHFLRGAIELLDQGVAGCAFLIREPNDLLFVHWETSVLSWKAGSFLPQQASDQPQFLAWTMH